MSLSLIDTRQREGAQMEKETFIFQCCHRNQPRGRELNTPSTHDSWFPAARAAAQPQTQMRPALIYCPRIKRAADFYPLSLCAVGEPRRCELPSMIVTQILPVALS